MPHYSNIPRVCNHYLTIKETWQNQKLSDKWLNYRPSTQIHKAIVFDTDSRHKRRKFHFVSLIEFQTLFELECILKELKKKHQLSFIHAYIFDFQRTFDLNKPYNVALKEIDDGYGLHFIKSITSDHRFPKKHRYLFPKMRSHWKL